MSDMTICDDIPTATTGKESRIPPRVYQNMRNENKLTVLTATAMMTAIILLATLFLKIPIAVGYIHLGDAMIFLAAMMLPRKHACFAGAVGASLADIMGGFVAWAPWTAAIKLVMVLIMHSALKASYETERRVIRPAGLPLPELAGFVLAAAVDIGGYYIAEGFLYGNWTAPMIGVPFNLLQASIGAILAVIISTMLCRTPLRDTFFYVRDRK